MSWQSLVEFAFWGFLALASYPFAFYPLLAAIFGRVFARQTCIHSTCRRPISIIIPAHNEQAQIERRTAELSRLAAAFHCESEVIVVSDGSTDRTAEQVKSLTLTNVRLIDLPHNLGKANALNCGVAAAIHEIILFADSRQSWDNDSIPSLVECFAEAEIGAVGGDLELRSADGSLRAVGLYWRLEKWLRIQESCWHSSIGVTGAISAVRKHLYCPMPIGTILDDVYWPMRVVMKGKRVLHNPRAKAYDQLPSEITDEYKRKLRTLSGCFQLVSLLGDVLLPWRNPVWIQFMSHKVMRLAMPWCFLGALLCNTCLLHKPIYLALFCLEITFISLGLLGSYISALGRMRLLGLASGILVLNYAAWMAFWIWIRGNASRSWAKVQYSGI